MRSDSEHDAVEKVLDYARRIAVVGLSKDPASASHNVASALMDLGYEVVPVNPTLDEVMGLRSYPTLGDVPGEIDVVDVFRRPEHLPGIAQEAVAARAKALWLQSGLRSEEARAIAEAAGLGFVQDRCLKIEAGARTRSKG